MVAITVACVSLLLQSQALCQCKWKTVNESTQNEVYRFAYGAVSYGEKSIVVGGFEPSGSDPAYIPVRRTASFTYDEGSIGMWNEGLPELPKELGGIAIGVDNTTWMIIVAGGTITSPLDQPYPGTLSYKVYTYNLNEGAWRNDVVSDLPMTNDSEEGDRTDSGGVVCGNGTAKYFFVTGGRRYSEAVGGLWVVLANTTAYDLVNNVWVELPQLNVARHQHGIVCDAGRIFVVGGSTKVGQGPTSGFLTGTVEMLDLNQMDQGWRLTTPLNIPRAGLTAISVGNSIMAIGGLGITATATVETLDITQRWPTLNMTWSYGEPLEVSRSFASVTKINSQDGNETVCVFSGFREDDPVGEKGIGNVVECCECV